MSISPTTAKTGSVDLYWLPVGAGGHCVRLGGHIFEALAARREHRKYSDLYHSALEVRLVRTAGSSRWRPCGTYRTLIVARCVKAR
jgi:hypothetical protein